MADAEAMQHAVEEVINRAGRMISEFGRKVHYREYANEKEVAEAIAEIVRATVTGVLDAVAKAAASDRARFDA
jgi:hypothetical protein